MLTKMEAEQGPKYLKAAKKIPRVSSFKPQTVNHISQTVDVPNLLNYKYIFKFYQAEILAVTGDRMEGFSLPFTFIPIMQPRQTLSDSSESQIFNIVQGNCGNGNMMISNASIDTQENAMT